MYIFDLYIMQNCLLVAGEFGILWLASLDFDLP